MSSTYDGVLFDLDGTLWDSSAACAKGWNQALENLGVKGHEVSDRDIQGVMGLPHEQIFAKVFPETKADEREVIAEACYEGELDVIRREGGALFPGVSKGLAELGRRYPLFIVSNCMPGYLETFLAATKLGSKFKDMECYGNTGKPKGDNIAALVRRNQLASPVYVGDTAGDQSAARHAGVPYLHVDYGFGEPTSACLRFADFPALVRFLLEEKV